MAKTQVSGSGSGVPNPMLRVFVLFLLSTTWLNSTVKGSPFEGIYCRAPQPSARFLFIILWALIFGAKQLLLEASMRAQRRGTNKWLCAYFHNLCMSKKVSDVGPNRIIMDHTRLNGTIEDHRGLNGP